MSKQDKLDNPLLREEQTEPSVLYIQKNVQGTVVDQSIPKAQQVFRIDEDTDVQRKRTVFAALMCCFCILLFLLLFFLIPRAPVISYESSTAYFNKIPMQVTQTYNVKNTNYYSITLSNFNNLVMNSNTYTLTTETSGGSHSYSFTFVAYGQGPTTTIASQDTVSLTLLYNSSSIAADTAVIGSYCYKTGITMYTTGNFDCSTSLGRYYTLPFRK